MSKASLKHTHLPHQPKKKRTLQKAHTPFVSRDPNNCSIKQPSSTDPQRYKSSLPYDLEAYKSGLVALRSCSLGPLPILAPKTYTFARFSSSPCVCGVLAPLLNLAGMASALRASTGACLGSCDVTKAATVARSSSGTALQRQVRIPAGMGAVGVEHEARGEVLMRVAQRTEPELYDGIANFYDESSGIWEEVWGEHMHHGYYEDEVVQAASKGDPDHRRAQIRMIEKSLAYAGVPGNCPGFLSISFHTQ